jgi:hypothetical protein
LELNLYGTGDLAGYERHVSVPIGDCEVHTGPRNPGDPVQVFPADMFRLQGGIVGDPDFDLLSVTAGTDYGLPSPGETTLTQLPSGDFAVDSFFDITYRVDFQGAPGSALEGLMGSTIAAERFRPGEVVDPGGGRETDWYQAGGSEFDFGGTPLPADFFGPGSDPFDGIIALQGNPAVPDGAHAHVVRHETAGLPNVGGSDTIDIEIVQLSLVSSEPIRVTYDGGGVPDSFFDVSVDFVPSGVGELDILRLDDHLDIETFSQALSGVFVFTNVDDPTEQYVWDYGTEVGPVDLQLAISPARYDYLPQPNYLWPYRSDMRFYAMEDVSLTSPQMQLTLRMMAIPGDFDGDGDVDAFDLLIWQNGYGTGTTFWEGDAELDGDVDAFDLLIWQNNYGAGPAAVPEPSAILLLATGALAVALLVRRRRR